MTKSTGSKSPPAKSKPKKDAKAPSEVDAKAEKAGKGKADGAVYKIIHRSLLKNAEYNPRTIDQATAKRLRENIKRTKGLVQAPVWNKRTGNIVGGHQRVAAEDILQGGTDYTLTVAEVDWDLPTEIEQNIALNNAQLAGDFDLLKLDELLERPDIELENAGFNITGLAALHDEYGVDLPEMFIPESERVDPEDDDEMLTEIEDALDEGEEAEAEQEEEEAEAEKIREIKDAKKKFAERQNHMREGNFAIRVVFVSSEACAAFLKAMELDEDAEMVDGMDIAEACGVGETVREAVAKAPKHKKPKKTKEPVE